MKGVASFLFLVLCGALLGAEASHYRYVAGAEHVLRRSPNAAGHAAADSVELCTPPPHLTRRQLRKRQLGA